MKEKYEKWTKDFLESWKNLEGIKTTELLSPDIEYFENPIDGPCKTFEDVIKLWEVVPHNQKDITYTYNIVMYTNDKCIINFQMQRTFIPTNEFQKIDGIFEIVLENNGLCKYFKQWRFTKSEQL